jgi:hypothetical protein
MEGRSTENHKCNRSWTPRFRLFLAANGTSRQPIPTILFLSTSDTSWQFYAFPPLPSSLPISTCSWQLAKAPPLSLIPSHFGRQLQIAAAPYNLPIQIDYIPIMPGTTALRKYLAARGNLGHLILFPQLCLSLEGRGSSRQPLPSLAAFFLRIHERELRHTLHQSDHNLKHKAGQRSPLLANCVKTRSLRQSSGPCYPLGILPLGVAEVHSIQFLPRLHTWLR